MTPTARVPHSYEMPRNTIDFSLAKKFGDHLELKLNVRDLLAEKIYYKQFADVTYSDGSKKEVEEIARCYKPGRNIGLQADTINFKSNKKDNIRCLFNKTGNNDEQDVFL